MTRKLCCVIGICLLFLGCHFIRVGARENAVAEARLAERAATPLPPAGDFLDRLRLEVERDHQNFLDEVRRIDAGCWHTTGWGCVIGGLGLMLPSRLRRRAS